MHPHLADFVSALGINVSTLVRDESLEGWAPASHSEAIQSAKQETTVDLSTSRVRVGFSRGHLLEVVFQVPLDVEGDPDSLQIAAEIYLEEMMGEGVLDCWVGSVAVDRIARTQGLLMVSERTDGAASHPLAEAASLIRRGVAAVTAELPASLFEAPLDEADWTALEIPPLDGGLQSDRRYASTRFPEALKCALEGAPFSSRRFTRGQEVFVWVRWDSNGVFPDERLEKRGIMEELVQARAAEGMALLAGTGFGHRSDYIDLWVNLDRPGLPAHLRALASEVGGLEFGFYDTELSERSLAIAALI